MMRLLVCGGRNYGMRAQRMSTERTINVEEERAHVRGFLDALVPRPTVIINGGARGADALVRAWADEHAIPVQLFQPEWIKYGLAAGPVRNQRMLDEGRPAVVIAFPGGSGTADMVRRALHAGVPVLQVPPLARRRAAPIPFPNAQRELP